MPKIVDHEAEKERIARSSIELFREKGYEGISFRALARELGISKSGLYHYFPSKEDLFSCCGTLLLSDMASELDIAGETDPVSLLTSLARSMLPQFRGEIRLLLDYIRIFPEQEELSRFMDGMRELLIPICGETTCPAVIKLILGDLLEKVLIGGTDNWEGLEKGLRTLLG